MERESPEEPKTTPPQHTSPEETKETQEEAPSLTICEPAPEDTNDSSQPPELIPPQNIPEQPQAPQPANIPFLNITYPFSITDIPEYKEIQEEEKQAEDSINSKTGDEQTALLEMFSLQKQRNQIYLRYLLDLRSLEELYESYYRPLADQRRQIVSGAQVPKFWLKVLQNHPMASSYITKPDKEILEHLIDIRAKEDVMSGNYYLEFEFSPNEFMQETVLKIEFEMDKDGEDPEKSISTTIHWLKNNPTQKVIKKKQKNKRTRNVRTITQTVKTESFFNLFQTKSAKDHDESDEDDSEAEDEEIFELEEQHDLCEMLKDDIIPNALMYHLGLKLEDKMGEKGPVKVNPGGNKEAECKTQ